MKPGDPLVRLMSHVRKTSRGCWLWNGTRDRKGYGHFAIFTDGRKKIVYPHRWLYQQMVGKVPKGKILVHACHIRNCVNPKHLELTTYSDLLSPSRGEGMAAINRRKTCCKHGHPFDKDNTYWYRGKRQCRQCQRRRMQVWLAGTTGNRRGK